MDLREIEEKWTRKWVEEGTFEADPIPDKPKCFVTFPFPYMNGPLHLGHAFTSTRVDVYARFQRMRGYNVLFPWAWHLTGEPITGAAERVAKGDESQIRIFREMDGVPEEELKKFVDPEYIARYYIEESKRSIQELGHSIDWRREFTTASLHPQFNRFIEWQYLKLREKGYVVKGTHPVVWCPNDQSPTGDHDRLRGEGASPVEFALLKFPYDGAFLPAATLRPETLFGVTNLWIRPEADYVRIRLGGEEWIVSEEAAEKLIEQKEGMERITAVKGSELVGKRCRHPLTGEEVLILPAAFVDPGNASGVVMSVPSHAPYDYLALRDLQREPAEGGKYGISAEELKEIRPISIIRVPSLGEHPAIEICEKMAIKDQNDPKAEEATETVYKEEFYKGVLRGNTGEYAGMEVREVKKRLVADFEERGIADRMYELSEEVVCRCSTRCVVKVLKDQWFLDYSDEGWKKRVKNALEKMRILPEEARANFEYTIDWLEAKACARKTGLGTPLPWDREWIVETLSDSTVYMAFYTLAKHINEQGIRAESLTVEVFDCLFYGEGDPEEIGRRNGIDPGVLEEMRGEFEYWMPVDLRNSAKELVPNHLTFYLFHHVALFPEEKWPKAIGVNGMISVEGEKMSKSRGNFVTLKRALERHGADATRAALLYASEGLRDPDWREKSAREMENRLRAFFDLALQGLETEALEGDRHIDVWLLSRLQRHLREAEEAYESLRTRSAFQSAFFDLWKDVKWYLRRDRPNGKVLREVLDVWVRILSPYLPALCEELWSRMGGEGSVAFAPWPEGGEDAVNLEVELWEEVIGRIVEDIENILKVAGVKDPKKIVLYTAPGWKWEVLEALWDLRELKGAMGKVMAVEALRKRGREASKYVEELRRDLSGFEYRVTTHLTGHPPPLLDDPSGLKRMAEKELPILQEARGFFEKEFGCPVEVYGAEGKAYDPLRKRGKARPLKPAIYIE
jgi:leucyl-tRNA synthetase